MEARNGHNTCMHAPIWLNFFSVYSDVISSEYSLFDFGVVIQFVTEEKEKQQQKGTKHF